MKKSGGEALVYERMASSTESPADITLLCAVLARQRMLVVIQKATELGVRASSPCSRSARCRAKVWIMRRPMHGRSRPCALRANADGRACPRCARPSNSLPSWRMSASPKQTSASTSTTGHRVRVQLDVAAPNADRARPRIVFAVGPEGGWSDEERAMLESRRCSPLRLRWPSSTRGDRRVRGAHPPSTRLRRHVEAASSDRPLPGSRPEDRESPALKNLVEAPLGGAGRPPTELRHAPRAGRLPRPHRWAGRTAARMLRVGPGARRCR